MSTYLFEVDVASDFDPRQTVKMSLLVDAESEKEAVKNALTRVRNSMGKTQVFIAAYRELSGATPQQTDK